MIKVGDRLPAANLKRLTADGIKDVPLVGLTQGKKVVLFAVPGAFTPTCSEQHLPGFLQQASALTAKGIDKGKRRFPITASARNLQHNSKTRRR
jgi:peroxiredoxin